MPADAASAVVVTTDAPDSGADGKAPVPGTGKADSVMPAASASTVVTSGDAVTTGGDGTSNPVPGTSAGDSEITAPAAPKP